MRFATFSVASHMRPVESRSIVAISLLGSETGVAAGLLDHGSYVLPVDLYCTETSSGEGPWSRMWVTPPTDFASACTLVSLEIWRTLLQVSSLLRRQIHVPAGDTAVVGSTAHQVPLYCQSLDCGFSPVESVTGMVVNVPALLPGAPCTGCGSRVGERLAGDRDELPVVARRVQRELDHAVGARVAHLARRQDRAEAGQRGAAGADHELADAEGRVGGAAPVHRREALVVVPVAAEQDVGAAVVEVLPQLLHVRVVPGGRPARLVPDGDDVVRRRGGEVVLEPQILRRAGRAASRQPVPGAGLALGVQHHHMPRVRARADVVAVVAERRSPAGPVWLPTPLK